MDKIAHTGSTEISGKRMIWVTNSICIKKEILHKKEGFGWGWDIAAPRNLLLIPPVVQDSLTTPTFLGVFLHFWVFLFTRKCYGVIRSRIARENICISPSR